MIWKWKFSLPEMCQSLECLVSNASICQCWLCYWLYEYDKKIVCWFSCLCLILLLSTGEVQRIVLGLCHKLWMMSIAYGVWTMTSSFRGEMTTTNLHFWLLLLWVCSCKCLWDWYYKWRTFTLWDRSYKWRMPVSLQNGCLHHTDSDSDDLSFQNGCLVAWVISVLVLSGSPLFAHFVRWFFYACFSHCSGKDHNLCDEPR